MSVADAIVGISPSQRSIARQAEAVLASRGLPAEIIAGALVNAHAESGLKPSAQSPAPEDSAGIWQLNAKGAGKGMSTAARQDVGTATKRIADEYARYGKTMRDAYAAGTRDVATFAAMWSTLIERPRDKSGAEAYRRKLAAKLFPGPVTKGGDVASGSGEARPMGLLVGLAVLAALAVGRAVYNARPANARSVVHSSQIQQPSNNK